MVFADGAIPNMDLGLVNFTFTDTPLGDLGFVDDAPDGSQAAFIGDTGTMSQTVNFTKRGSYAIGFYAATKTQTANAVTLTRFPFLLPPLPEQTAIATYLDAETANLDALVARVEEAIERLQEYRTALITAAVTGKIDVRAVKR